MVNRLVKDPSTGRRYDNGVISPCRLISVLLEITVYAIDLSDIFRAKNKTTSLYPPRLQCKEFFIVLLGLAEGLISRMFKLRVPHFSLIPPLWSRTIKLGWGGRPIRHGLIVPFYLCICLKFSLCLHQGNVNSLNLFFIFGC